MSNDNIQWPTTEKTGANHRARQTWDSSSVSHTVGQFVFWTHKTKNTLPTVR